MKATVTIVAVTLLFAAGLFVLSRYSVRQAILPLPSAILLSPPMRPVLAQALGNGLDSEEHAKYFLLLVRQHQYAPARSLMTPEAQKTLSTAALQEQWTEFESVHGRVTQWKLMGENVNLLPASIDKRYSVNGDQGNAGVATLRMTQSAGSWQIAALKIVR